MNKATAALLALVVLTAAGCYDAPLAQKQDLPLDSSLIGLWHGVGSDGSELKLLVSRHSETEYAIKASFVKDTLYLRGYPVKVAGVACVQLFATDENYNARGGPMTYFVYSYGLAGGELFFGPLNSSLVGTSLKTNAELLAAFLRHKDNPNLFSRSSGLKRLTPPERTLTPPEIALMEAAMKGDVVAVRSLLDGGADVNTRTRRGHTPLTAACHAGHLPAVRLLLARGADTGAKTEAGLTPLMLAASKNHTPVVHALLAGGADVNAKGLEGYTALTVASLTGQLAAVRALLARGANVNARTDNGSTALMSAAGENRLPVVRALLAAGADVNARQSSDGTTALMSAAERGHLAVVQTLLARGANAGAASHAGTTALMFAASEGHLPTVQALLAGGADANAKTKDGTTALLRAIVKGHIPVVEALLAKGADADARDEDGWTPLMVAAGAGHVNVVKALLAKGANAHATTKDGGTALDFALEQNHPAVAEVLRAELNKPCPPSLSARHEFSLNGPVTTGVAVRRGDRLTFRAGGVVTFGMMAGSGGPQGVASFQGYRYFADEWHGALIGRVRESSNSGWFLIGEGRTLTSQADGTLELDVNDTQPENNSGEFTVEVSICRAR